MSAQVHRSLVAALLLALSFSGCSKDPERAKQEYVKSGDRFAHEGKLREAAVQYRNAIQQDPKFGEARFKHAEALDRLGETQAAGREYVRAADSLTSSVDAQLRAAKYLLLTQQFEDARTRAQKALRLAPKNPEALMVFGSALAGLKDFDGALRELEEAAKLDPTSAATLTSIGTVQLARGSLADAESAFRRAVEANPKLPQSHLALANYLWAAGRRGEAEQSLKTAVDLAPSDTLPRRALVTFYMSNRRALEAEPHMKAMADADRSPGAPLKLALADYYVMTNRIDKASAVLDEITKAGTAPAATQARTAALAFARNDRAGANRSIDELLARDPKNVPALLVKAKFLATEGKPPEAIQLATDAVAADPGSIQAHYALGTYQRMTQDVAGAIKSFNEVLRLNPKAAAAQVQLSQLYLVRGATQPALQMAQDAAKNLPRDPAVALNLVKNLTASGDVRSAENVAKRLVAVYPRVAAVQAALGGLALRKGNKATATRAFAAAQTIDPDSLEALAGLVAIDLTDRRVDDAKSKLERQLARQPNDPAVNLLAAQVYGGSGVLKKAEQLLQKTIELQPSNIQAYALLARIYGRERRLPEARKSWEAILARRPDDIRALTVIAMIEDVEGNKEGARKTYERILQIDPRSPVAANNLAFMYAEEGGNLDVALQLAQTAKQVLPDVPGVDDTLGWVYYKKNLPSLAIPVLEHAVQAAPERAPYRYRLGLAYAMANDRGKAKATLEAAFKLDPKLAELPEARQAMTVVSQ